MPQFVSNIKHNKKRNAGLLYEWLINYITESISIKKDTKMADLASNIAVRYFNKNTELGKELEAIRFLADKKGAFSLNENANNLENMLNMTLLSNTISDFKNKIKELDLRQSYIEKSNLIKEVNLTLTSSLYNGDIDDYRLYASIYGLMEAIKKENHKEQLNYEMMISNNLLSKENKDDKIKYNDDDFNKLNESIFMKIKNYDENQKSLIENWKFFIEGNISEDIYEEFILSKSKEVCSIIDEAISLNKDHEVLCEKLNTLKNTYSLSSLNKLNLFKKTEHILEGFNIKRLL